MRHLAARLLLAVSLLPCTLGRLHADEPPAAAPADDEFAGLPHEERKAGGDAHKLYRLIGPRDQAPAPAEGHPLLLVLPGGDGGAESLPFAKRIALNALGKDWLAAQVVSVKWTPEQQIIWPTEKNAVTGQRFSTEEFIEAVVADAAKARKVDPARVYALGWSSSGPALYAHALTKKPAVQGWYVAMSVFRPERLPSLTTAKGRAFFLDHSPDDRTCPFADAEKAQAELTKVGAKVKLVSYEGGHGWHGALWQRMKDGVAYLEEHRPRRRR